MSEFRRFVTLAARALTLLTTAAPGVGCLRSAEREVVVYSALDREFSEEILEEFTRQTGVKVRAKYDVESTKTVGLVTEILQERNRPRCDLFWNNEILHTLRLEQQGLLARARPARASQFPASFRSPEGRWYGLAARARILLVNRDVTPEAERPDSIEDLIDPKWKGRVGLAKPLFGTTATHAAVLFARWGPDRAERFFRALHRNARVLSGNRQVAMAVGRGRLAFGLTDTDDASIEQEQGAAVEIVYPDQGEGGMGALLIPNTAAILRGCPHAEEARRLLDYLLSPSVEARLARGRSAQIPLNPAVSQRPRVLGPTPVKWMDVDFAAAAACWDRASTFLRDEFARAD